MFNKKIGIVFIIAAFFLGVLAAEASDKPDQTGSPAELDVSFVDKAWDGKWIPRGSQCQRFGGKNPMTPALAIKKIPAEANAIIMEYSDRSFYPMDNGGHGMVGFKIDPGTTSVEIPSIPGHSFDLPDGFFIIKPHKNPDWDKAGAYMPPCSGGSSNSYYVTIKAVHQSSDSKEETKPLAIKILELGKY